LHHVGKHAAAHAEELIIIAGAAAASLLLLLLPIAAHRVSSSLTNERVTINSAVVVGCLCWLGRVNSSRALLCALAALLAAICKGKEHNY
jgi:hypothetical protein